MLKIKLMNKIAKVGTDMLSLEKYQIGDDLQNEDAILVRSASLHDLPFSENLRAIARCGAGVNNIPVEKCTKEGIVVFNTPGANANAVKELAIASLILASRDLVGGIDWVKTLAGQTGIAKAVEAGKSAFVGHELAGKTLGVVGLGAIGGMVANCAISLGMKVMGYDPYITAKAAWSLAPICEKSIAQMKTGVRIINLARADLVNAEDMKKALQEKKVSAYVTDFPTDETAGVEGIIAIPHLGASTVESEDHCAVMAVQQLDEFLSCGNIRNSVNFPTVCLPRSIQPRVCIMHENIPNMLSQITSAFSAQNLNIENMANGSKGEVAYTIVETNAEINVELIKTLSAIEGVFGVRAF